jgi:MFS family permease
MRACSLVAAVFLVAVSALVLAGAFTVDWYRVEQTSVTIKMGLLKQCTEKGGRTQCESNEYGDMKTCDRSGSQMETRVHAVLGLMLASAAMGLIGAAMSGVAFAKPTGVFGSVSLLFCVLAAACVGSALALFIYSIENWYFCDKKFCDMLKDSAPATECTNKLSISFFLGIAAAACTVVAFICQVVSIATAPKDGAAPSEEAAQRQRHQQQRGVTQSEPSYVQDDTHYAAEETVPPPPAGDWVYDDASGLYWSDTEYLYLDTVANQYYDPKSGQWYDPANGQWYFKD